jgi:hypothetical protein|tara:strand:+ start:199 stop:489 length:291 start_codon:yes stop_codon:yes gene_type:complete
MKNKFLIISLAMSAATFSQTKINNSLPNIQDISSVMGFGNQKYVVTLQDSEIYSDHLDSSVKRDTFCVSPKYKNGDLIDETEWETGYALWSILDIL